MPTILTEDFDLHQTIFSGQVFRWEEVPLEGKAQGMRSYFGFIHKIPVKLEQRGKKVYFISQHNGLRRSAVRRFLGIDHPMADIIGEITRDEFMQRAVEQTHGLRVVCSDPFECLISFITSQNSNIPRIRRSLNLLASRASQGVRFEEGDGRWMMPFPDRSSLLRLRESTLRKIGFGYRAPYLRKAFRMIDEEFITAVEEKPYEGALGQLLQVHGIGEKVADCALLFGFGRLEAFPVDVWIKKVMQEKYFPNESVTEREMKDFARGYFGHYAGYAQQYLFQFIRSQGASRGPVAKI